MKIEGSQNNIRVKHTQENKPLISVITVVRNSASLLEKTILSVINQSYANIEFIVIDGASTDKTIDVIKKYDDRIDYWISEPDKGIYNAMNKGILVARGEWINFMNAGDVFASNNTVNELLPDFLNHKEALVLHGNIYFNTFDGKLLLFKSKPTEQQCHENLIRLYHQAIFFNNQGFVRYGLFDETFKIAADLKWYNNVYRILKDAAFSYTDKVICIFGEGGMSSNIGNFWVMRKETFAILRTMTGSYTLRMKFHIQTAYYFLRRFLIQKILKNTFIYKFYRKCIS